MSEAHVPRLAFTSGKAGSLVYLAAVYTVAVAAAWWVFQVAASPWWSIALGLSAATLVCFAGTLPVNNGSVFDAYWSVLPPALAVYLSTLAPEITARTVAVHLVVWAWAIRLTLNWARSFPGLHHEDFRYLDLYASVPLPRWAVQLLLVEGAPTLQVVLGCLPLYPALVLGGEGFGWLDGLGLAVGLAATTIEFVADEQMRRFARTSLAGAHMDRGLWRYSRHPNYFGEILFWVSLWLFALAAAPASWWTGIGAVAMIAMFVFASIPMMERRSQERRPGYAAYAARTSALVPWPPKERAPAG